MITYIRYLLAGGTERQELDKTRALLRAMQARGMGATPGHMSAAIRQQALSAVELAMRLAEPAELTPAGRDAA